MRYLSIDPAFGSRLHVLIHCRLVSAAPSAFVSQSESSTEKTHQLRQPIRIEYYVTRVVSQSESSITSPESSLRHPRALSSGGGPVSALGPSRLAIAYLNTWGPPPPPLPDQLTLLLLTLGGRPGKTLFKHRPIL